MDPDDNGLVSPREMVRSLDLGLRPIDVDEKPCTEIFRLKDGLPQRVVCGG
ncbi:MAG: hypothetical protein KDK53_17390 [Maritimibacter sp.]|nr:hypothetical protein [Maritimibacter sp.]